MGFTSFPSLSFLSLASLKILLLFLNSLHGFCISCFNVLLLVFWLPSLGTDWMLKRQMLFFSFTERRVGENLFWLHPCVRILCDKDGGWFYGWQWACQMTSEQTRNAEHMSTWLIHFSVITFADIHKLTLDILEGKSLYTVCRPLVCKAVEYW